MSKQMMLRCFWRPAGAARRMCTAATTGRVGAWTEWGRLREIAVGNADGAHFPPVQPALVPEINREGGACTLVEGGQVVESTNAGAVLEQELGAWPRGAKSHAVIAAANAQLDNLAAVLADLGVAVHRPDVPGVDWSSPLVTPFFEVENQYCATCPRDVVATVGNIVLEAAMSRRDRQCEIHAYRGLIRELWCSDEAMLWKAAPKPSCADAMYNAAWWDLSTEERHARMHDFKFCIQSEEVIFDAADMMRMGKDVFVQLSTTCNAAGIEWLRRELAPHGVRVHTVRFPYDLAPSHLDCTFVPLRPGLVLTNPERPIMEEDARIFRENGWRFVDSPQPTNPVRPWASQSSKWLAMNVLSVSESVVVAEEQETALHELLESEGFEVVKVPFRAVYEFGGGLHCATWDIRRDGSMVDLFPTAAAANGNSGTGYGGLEVRPDRREWSGIDAVFSSGDATDGDESERLDIDGHPVMQSWEQPYMASLAEVATRAGGRVLEIGFGLGLSAAAIQSGLSDASPPTEHLIMEANEGVFAKLELFASRARVPVTPMGPALWQDTLDSIPDASLDGVLYDTYPLSKEEQHTHQFEFIGRVRAKLKAGGVLTYCNLTSLGVLKGQYEEWAELFRETQLPHLLEAGWHPEEISFEVAPTAPPPDCEYYSHETGLVPMLVKRHE